MITLISIFHDRTGNKYDLFEQNILSIISLYQEAYLTISDATDPRYETFCINHQLHYRIIPANGAGHARREVLKFGLESQNDYYHYCDGDRILTWYIYHSNELINMIESINKTGYTVIGRTKQAFLSHPRSWYETETITNQVVSDLIGLTVDITAGSCAFDYQCATIINQLSKDLMTDSEWLILCHLSHHKIDYYETNGLRYIHDINKTNRDLGEAHSYLSRLKLATIITESAVKLFSNKKTM